MKNLNGIAILKSGVTSVVYTLSLALFLLGVELTAQSDSPIVSEETVFEEIGGIVAVEAEYFYKQTKTDLRKWYRFSPEESPDVRPDPDPAHLEGASNNCYLEILPDTRANHSEKLIDGVNFSNDPGKLAIIHYSVWFNTPGRYYVWVRAYSTGSEDNGLHVGIDGTWPESGRRMQWCEGKNSWFWESRQRTNEQHCGVPFAIYLDIDKPGKHDIQFSLREDGFEMDSWLMTTDINYNPRRDIVPGVKLRSGTLPEPFTSATVASSLSLIESHPGDFRLLKATEFPVEGTGYYINDGKWLAINPERNSAAATSIPFPFPDGNYDIVLLGVGESDGNSSYSLWISERNIGEFSAVPSRFMFEEGSPFNALWENVMIRKGDLVKIGSATASNDGKEFSRGRWAGIVFATLGRGRELTGTNDQVPFKASLQNPEGALPVFTDRAARLADGDGTVVTGGELKQWHKVTLTLDGPFAHELDTDPNPFTDYAMDVVFTHESGSPEYSVPGYFAADGDAANTGADRGTKWRAHLSPDKTGTWNYTITFRKGKMASVSMADEAASLKPYDGVKGSFTIGQTDKVVPDLRARGRLEYNGTHYLRFKGDGSWFLKAGADSPETLLAYKGFDGTYSVNMPLKEYDKHLLDWKEGDPSWRDGKGKGIVGVVNYLSEMGVNSFSFLTYNAGGDGDNVWPFSTRDDKFSYDCSKLDQWQILFDHAQSRGMHLHFKTQETENDDNTFGQDEKESVKKESLDGGDLGSERKLYYRELIARFSYLLALNWNLGEENTQTTEQRKAMAVYFKEVSPYPHNIVLHTFPAAQEAVYTPLLGDNSDLTGASLQNDWKAVHRQTLKWIGASAEAGKPWVVANDEQGNAGEGVPPDPGYPGFDEKSIPYDLHDIRKQVLWANLMAGGAGVEYYFGYKLPENDIICEDMRSRDRSWDYASKALSFFRQNNIPFWQMRNRNDLVGNSTNSKEKYCFALEGRLYLVYLAYAKDNSLDLSGTRGSFRVKWYNPRTGGELLDGSVTRVRGGGRVNPGSPPSEEGDDWLIV
ncbi:MAG: DUF5060 domain-containing protein, partial [Bacteroidales bacterium]|nr:DUF5060 domain-containing protein [Bacteroidales bacterium]